ncbi:MAG: hypothetical protein JWQ13_4107 [Ramlibacter sp.]|nr:hypothetical protein [Ramlibacter sp.]
MAVMRPALIIGSASARPTIMPLTSPDATAWIAGAVPLYGTCCSSKPRRFAISAMIRWVGWPWPPEA